VPALGAGGAADEGWTAIAARNAPRAKTNGPTAEPVGDADDGAAVATEGAGAGAAVGALSVEAESAGLELLATPVLGEECTKETIMKITPANTNTAVAARIVTAHQGARLPTTANCAVCAARSAVEGGAKSRGSVGMTTRPPTGARPVGGATGCRSDSAVAGMGNGAPSEGPPGM
jgi:hypothetical protein